MENRIPTLSSALIALSMFASPGVVAADDLNAREKAAQQAAGELIKQLGAALKKEMGSKGPAAAITVCRDLAPQISGGISRSNGWRMTRVSSKVRNPLLGMPDDWETRVLTDFEARAAKGEKYAEMGFGEVVQEGDRRYYRFMKPLAIQPVCLTCHGSDEKIAEGVKAQLAENYPHDRARGYQVGDLRGAVSIKQPMDIPLAAPAAAQ